jgi:quercetin dioxygenase-like cupin family protein
MTTLMTDQNNDNTPSPNLQAIRLFNLADGACTFERGTLALAQHININYFFAQTEVETYEMIPHPAPRRQFVVTLKGKLRFRVSNGETFMLEPGIILIAEDTLGPGHSWEIVEGEEWQRLYLPMEKDSDSYFKAADKASID